MAANRCRPFKRKNPLMNRRASIFISYHRDGGSAIAQLLKEKLERKHCDVFLDVYMLGAGRFDNVYFGTVRRTYEN